MWIQDYSFWNSISVIIFRYNNRLVIFLIHSEVIHLNHPDPFLWYNWVFPLECQWGEMLGGSRWQQLTQPSFCRCLGMDSKLYLSPWLTWQQLYLLLQLIHRLRWDSDSISTLSFSASDNKAITYQEILENECSRCEEHEEQHSILDNLFCTMQARHPAYPGRPLTFPLLPNNNFRISQIFPRMRCDNCWYSRNVHCLLGFNKYSFEISYILTVTVCTQLFALISNSSIISPLRRSKT